MKGLILSGGTGSRLRPLTFSCAKQLLPVANKPILFYALETLKAAGIREIGIVVGETAPQVRQEVGDGSNWGIRVTYLPQEAPLGLAHAVKIASSFLGNDPFLMFLGDNLIGGGVQELVARFNREQPSALVLLTAVSNPNQFGIAEVQGNRIIRVVEKPSDPPSNLALVGVYLFSPLIAEAIDRIQPSWRNELEITDAIQELISCGARVEYQLLEGWWKDTGSPADLLEANRVMLDMLTANNQGQVDEASFIYGRVNIGQGTEIINSIIRGPVIIGENCRIVNSLVGPYTALADQVTITYSEIENSIILERSKVMDLARKLENSLIGRDTLVCRETTKTGAGQFLIGDSCRVGLV